MDHRGAVRTRSRWSHTAAVECSCQIACGLGATLVVGIRKSPQSPLAAQVWGETPPWTPVCPTVLGVWDEPACRTAVCSTVTRFGHAVGIFA
jgi:hypothetical protein